MPVFAAVDEQHLSQPGKSGPEAAGHATADKIVDLDSLTTAPTASHALETGPTGTGAEQGSTLPEIQQENTILDSLHAGISRSIQGSATWMDSFFGDRRYDISSNQSFVRFRYNVFLEKDSSLVKRPELQVRVVLPQMRERTHLVFSGMRQQESDFSAMDSSYENQGLQTGQDSNATAAVQQTFFESAQQNFSMRAGFKLHDNRPVAAIGPQYRVLFPLNPWNLRFIEEATWTSDVGWEARSTVDLERELPRNIFFRASNDWIWKASVDGYVYAFVFTLGQPISPRKALEYEWVNIFGTKPANALNEVDLRARYRQRIWRDWLFFEVTPQYRFPRDRSFKATPGVLFRLDLFFGSYPVL